ncbi:MAG: endonuclease/exonuclease/phosphatase family protein [Bacteroidota bacterium]
MKKKKQKKKSFLTKTILLFNGIAIILLLLSYIAPFVSPAKFWPLAFIGLSYPGLLLINIGFILYWILRYKKYFILSLIAVLLGYSQLNSLFQWNYSSTEINEKNTNIKLLSYNVRVFDIYNYGSDWKHRYGNRDNIFNFLTREDFDIICFQEFVHDKSGNFKTQDTLSSFLKAKNFHSEYSKSSRNVNFFGLATYSSYPIINRGKIVFETHGGNLCIYSDILINNDTVRVYNVHFESIGLSPEDHIYVENIISANSDTNDDIKSSGRRVLGRLKIAFIRRALQSQEVAEHISESPFPVILAGDFNDTPSSYVYRLLSKQLYDSFKKGRGLGQTYLGAIPGFRIDYIMHSEEFETLQYNTGKEEYSDHYPIWVLLKKRD